MGKSTLRVAEDMIGDGLFFAADHPVKILDIVRRPEHFGWDLVIEGEDVPDAENVLATVTEERNRGGDRMRRLTFKVG